MEVPVCLEKRRVGTLAVTPSGTDTVFRVRCTGLPAGPISNPGLAAIKAALEPQPNEDAKDAYFFVTDLEGNYYYAHTLAEHNANCKTAAAVNKSLKN